MYLYGFPGARPARLGVRIGVYRALQQCVAWRTPALAGRLSMLRRWREPRGVDVQPLPASSGSAHEAWIDSLAQHPPSRPGEAPHVLKDAAYLRWRYRDHPQQSGGDEPLYTLWLVHRRALRVGWLVTRAFPEPIVVDSALAPDDVAGAMHGLQRVVPAPGGWTSWLAHESAVSVATPIHAVEVLGRPFHPEWPVPLFQPGDTDVF